MRIERQMMRPRKPRCRRSSVLALSLPFLTALSLVVLGGAVPARAEFVLAEPQSPVYYQYTVVAGERLQLEMNSAIEGNAHTNDRADLDKGSRVSGDLSAVGKVQNKGTVEGELVEGADPVALPTIPDEATLRGLADRILEEDVTFEDAVIDDIVFVAGTVRLRGTVRGTGTIIATKDIRIDTVGGGARSLMEEMAVPPQELHLSLIALDDVRIGKDRFFCGAVHAGRDVMTEQGLVFEGVMVAGRTVQIKKDAVVTFLSPDELPPVVTVVSPEDGAVLEDPFPTLQAEVRDNFSGVDGTKLVVRVDGVDVTAEVTVTVQEDGSLTLTWTPQASLSDGPHSVEITVLDQAGNSGEGGVTFSVLTVPPEMDPPILRITAPRPVVLNEVRPKIVVEYAPGSSPLDLNSLAIRLDGTDVTASCGVTPTVATCEPVAELAAGTHRAEADIRSTTGTLAGAAVGFAITLGEGPHTVEVESGAADTYLDPCLLYTSDAADEN